MTAVINILIYILSFIFIWLGAGLIVSSASKFSQKLRLSSFAFSFIFLGILTSIPELSVGLQAVVDHDAEIFIGNLMGGIVVLFLVVIPLLAVFGNGISLKHELDQKTLFATIGVIIAPAFTVLDKQINTYEGVILILLYVFLLIAVEKKNGIFDKSNSKLLNIKAYSSKDIFKILFGIAIVFVSSSLIVDKTVYFANTLNVSSFYISLFIVALGTDLPELSLAIRSVVSGKKEIAMGDYIGAAAISTFLFGLFIILHQGTIYTDDNFIVTFIFILLSLGLFYLFFRTQNYISRRNGFLLLGGYVLFVFFQLMS